MEDVTPSPQDVNARYATGLRPGLTGSLNHGLVIAAWMKGKTVPVLVTGVAVK